MKSVIAAALLACLAAPAFGQSVPKLNYKATCDGTPPVGMDKKATVDSCMSDEKGAQAQLPAVWAKATKASRNLCLAETTQGGLPSYVELITCLQGENILGQLGPDGQ
ncbi:MAG: hypothetical protein U1E28_10295 [Beijerinckiaceae bacterium]